MAQNENATQLPQQSGSATLSSLFYAVTGGATDTGLPLSVLVNNLGLTGTPTAPTATVGTNTTQIATTAFATTNFAPINFTQTGTGAVTVPVNTKLKHIVDVLDFGADPTGTVDATAAINAALTAALQIYIPPGTYKISGPLTLTKTGHSLIGAGVGTTIITNSTTNTVSINCNSNLVNLNLSGFTVTRSATAVSGAHGIDFSQNISLSSMSNIISQNNWNGIQIGVTDFSTMNNIVSQKNLNYGIYQFNQASNGTIQWYPSNILVQQNASNGWLVQAVAGPSQAIVGTYTNIYSFANTGRGLIFLGLAGCPIQDIRIIGGFLGQDGNDELYLDTYGDQHKIESVFLELAGTAATGPTLATPASNLGNGVQITTNNTSVQLVGVHANGNSQDGYFLSAGAHLVSGCRATNNGLAATANRQNGMNLIGGRAVITGCLISNNGVSTSQKNGVLTYDGNAVSLIGNDLTNNNTAAWAATANLTAVTSVGNLPNSLNVNISPTGAVIVGSAPTGGFGNGAGTINVSGGLLKNNVAYTNP